MGLLQGPTPTLPRHPVLVEKYPGKYRNDGEEQGAWWERYVAVFTEFALTASRTTLALLAPGLGTRNRTTAPEGQN